jgi:mono/diheme cytochrome c family protein
MSSRMLRVAVGVGLAAGGTGYLGLHAAPPQLPVSVTLAAQAAGPQTQAAASPERALLQRYCITCHSDAGAQRGIVPISLQPLDPANVSAHTEAWEKVVRKLRTATMPPAGSPRPDPAAYAAFASTVESALDRAAAARPNPGRVPAVHRLNRFEYTNAIRDLLALEIDGDSMLPDDESSYGFDNNASVLSLTPALLERYLLAARKIGRLALGDPTIRPAVATYRMALSKVQDARENEDLPFGTRGGAAIRHAFPLDGEYVLKISLRRNWSSPEIRGIEKREQIDVRLDGVRVKLFEIGGECAGSRDPKCIVDGSATLSTSLYGRSADDALQVRFPAKAGTRLVGVAFLNRNSAQEGVSPEYSPPRSSSFISSVEGGMAADIITIEGPFNAARPTDSASRREIFVCQPTGAQDEESCARKILSTLVRRAYRRPVTDRDVEPLLGLYRNGRRDGDFETGIQFALEGLLVSPNFLLRVERDPANLTGGTPYRISDLELASRLSFFLWSSIPDDALLDAATRGELKDPKVLDQQVRRMLADRRATALVRNFTGQWLQLRNMRVMEPDPRVFPDFDESLREAFIAETEMFLESQMREDRPLTEILTANYTFVNERLAKFYGFPNVYGSHFRRVTSSDPRRQGLLSQGSILTLTSYSTRTSPVVRGKFLLDNIVGAPPPPPPPNVPPLPDAGKGAQVATSMRDRMEAHRKNPVCAGCHARMDPLGFAFENFDGIGKWRSREANLPINASGTFPNGAKFDGPAEFVNGLVSQREEFVRTFADKLLTYALGRGADYYDQPAIRRIVREAAPGNYRWSAVILGVVKSAPFQMRMMGAAPTRVAVRH